MEELEILLKEKIMIRRLKRDVITQLPAKRRQMVMLDPGSVKTNKILTSSHSLVGQAKVRHETWRDTVLFNTCLVRHELSDM